MGLGVSGRGGGQGGRAVRDRVLKKQTQCKRASQQAILLIPPGMETLLFGNGPGAPHLIPKLLLAPLPDLIALIE